MLAYKFVGLDATDSPTPYYYATLAEKPTLGHVLTLEETGNRYAVVSIQGEGLVGDGESAKWKLAWADINRGEKVPTLWLEKLSDLN